MLSIQLYLRETPLALRTASTKIAIFMNHTLNCESNSSPIVWGWSSESRVSAALRMSSISISYKWKIHYTLDYHTAHCQLVNRYKFRSLSHVLATLQIRQDHFGWWSKLESSQRAQSLSTLGFLWRLWLLNDKFLAMKNIMNLQLGIFSVSFFKEFLSTKLQDCSKFFFVKWITPEAKIICVKKGK